MAAILADLLPDILQDVRVWMSDHNIGAGSRWAQELTQQLDGTNFGILCLTPENLTAPWLLFEAGALSKKFEDSRVVPFLLGLKATDVEFPLAQFQSVNSDEAGTRKLIHSLNAARTPSLEDQRVERSFKRCWPDFSERLGKIPEFPSPRNSDQKRSDRDLIEETLRLVRELQKPEEPFSVGPSDSALEPKSRNSIVTLGSAFRDLVTTTDVSHLEDAELIRQMGMLTMGRGSREEARAARLYYERLEEELRSRGLPSLEDTFKGQRF